MATKTNVVIGDVNVEIIKKPSLKNLYVRIIPPDGMVTANAPNEMSDEDIRLFILKRMPEIVKVRKRMMAQERQSKREYVSGESYYLWGKPRRLQVVRGGQHYKIEKLPQKIVLTIPATTSETATEKAVNEWYRQELKRVMQAVIARCERRMGITANEYRVKNMKTKWGTCNITKRRIWINLQLAKKPPECLEYVLTHEMVHLLEKNHTPRFTALVEKFYPAWREAKNILADLPLDYLEKEAHEPDEQQ